MANIKKEKNNYWRIANSIYLWIRDENIKWENWKLKL